MLEAEAVSLLGTVDQATERIEKILVFEGIGYVLRQAISRGTINELIHMKVDTLA